jgi:hypothetical protein
VSTELQKNHTMNEIKSFINTTAFYFSQMLGSEQVSSQLRDNIFAVRIISNRKILCHQNLSWKRLFEGSFERFVTDIFSSEETQAVSIIFMIADALRILSTCLGKALLREHRGVGLESIKEDQLQRIATAASTIANFCNHSKLQVQRLSQSIHQLKLHPALDNLMMIIKKSEHQAVSILRELKMDLASKMEVSKALATELNLEKEAAEALKQGEFLQWNSTWHTRCWSALIQMRRNLQSKTSKEVTALLKENKVQDVGTLIDLGTQAISQKLESSNVEAQEIKEVLQEFNLVRGAFWNMKTKQSHRNLWLLVREQYLHTEDLRLMYSILYGHLIVPAYIFAALHDGLDFLTSNLAHDCNLYMVEVPFTFEIDVGEGKIKNISCTRHFFTDKKPDYSSLCYTQLGQVSAEAIVELLMAIRCEVTHSLGWAPCDVTVDYSAVRYGSD